MSAIGAYWRRVQGLEPNAKWYLACTVLQSMAMNLSSLLFNLYLISLGFDAAALDILTAPATLDTPPLMYAGIRG